MRRTAVLTAVAVLAAGSASGVADAGHTEKIGPAGIATKTVPFDQQFIDLMAAHHQMAVDMAKMVPMHSKREQVRSMASLIVQAQTKEIAELRRLRKQWYGSGQFANYGAMGERMMRAMGMEPHVLDGLRNSPRFDYAFLSGMIPHHAGAITMARWETQAGTHAALRRMAAHLIHDESVEVGDMIQLRINWYGS